MKSQVGFLVLLCTFAVSLLFCEPKASLPIDKNPHAEGFDFSNSDPKAIAIADQVMSKMGGRENWNNTQYLQWNFFGSRLHTWDRYSGNIIIKSLRDSLDITMNIDDQSSITLLKNGEVVNHPDSLQKYWEVGKRWWINDSYWLIMPFKLKDSGVTLSYMGVDTTLQGEASHSLELTFKEVGVTPGNKYKVYIDTLTSLVNQWDYFPTRTDSLPRFQMSWENYQDFNGILLSSNRGERLKITQISAHDSLSKFFE